MTQNAQTLTTIGMPRRRIVIGCAWDLVTGMNLSPAFKRSLLGPQSANGRPSSQPEFLRIYFALRAKNFPPMSAASQEIVRQQREQRIAARKRRQQERETRHRMPADLNAAQRDAWIAARKSTNNRALHLAAE